MATADWSGPKEEAEEEDGPRRHPVEGKGLIPAVYARRIIQCSRTANEFRWAAEFVPKLIPFLFVAQIADCSRSH
jgi:hypothetical protein